MSKCKSLILNSCGNKAFVCVNLLLHITSHLPWNRPETPVWFPPDTFSPLIPLSLIPLKLLPNSFSVWASSHLCALLPDQFLKIPLWWPHTCKHNRVTWFAGTPPERMFPRKLTPIVSSSQRYSCEDDGNQSSDVSRSGEITALHHRTSRGR